MLTSRFLLLPIILFFCLQLVHGQEKIASDSLKIYQPAIEYNQIGSENPFLNDNFLNFQKPGFEANFIFDQPLLPDFSEKFDFSKFNKPSRSSFYRNSFSDFSGLPFQHGTVFNQATYQITDRFSMGGNSFGAHSIFEIPQLNSTIQEMSVKGASMFMQYKFSNNFKVQTRVSISNHGSFGQP